MNKVSDHGNAVSVPTAKGSVAQGILVLGMHRSGTSACTRVLNLLGCTLSSQLAGGGEGNETGHWESIEALSLDDEMLASAGSSHEDWGPINGDWRVSAVRSQMVLRASKVLADHAKLGPLFAIKDPRMCRLADVWLEAATEARVEPLVLLMLRNPAEVAASLEARDLMAVGYGELLWLRHVLDAEFFTRGQKRAICRFDQLLNNWQGLIAKIKSELSVAFPRNSPKIHAEISQFLSHSYRHHAADSAMVIEDLSYSHWLRQTFQVMLTWSEQGEDAVDYPALDKIRTELDHAYGAFAKLLLTREMTGEAGYAGQLRGELAALREENERKAEALQVAVNTAEVARAAAAERESELAARIDTEAAHVQSLQSEIERLNAEVAARTTSDEEVAALNAKLSERAAELTSVQAALIEAAERKAEALQVAAVSAEGARAAAAEREAELVARIDTEAAHAQSLQSEIERLNAKVAAHTTSDEEVAALNTKLSERTAELASAQEAFSNAQAEVDADRQHRAEAEEQLAKALNDIHEQQLRNAELAGQLSATQSAMVQRQEELAQFLVQYNQLEQMRIRGELECEKERDLRIQLERRMIAADGKIGALETHLEEAHLAAEQRVSVLTNDLARLTVLLRQQEEVSVRAAPDAAERFRSGHMSHGPEDQLTLLASKPDAQLENRLTALLKQRDQDLGAAEVARGAAERQLAARFAEIASLTKMLRDTATESDQSKLNAQWLRRVNAVSAGFPRWWVLMPSSWRRKREHARYMRKGLFNAEKYLKLYPDVAANGMDPIRHYILHGMDEDRRNPL